MKLFEVYNFVTLNSSIKHDKWSIFGPLYYHLAPRFHDLSTWLWTSLLRLILNPSSNDCVEQFYTMYMTTRGSSEMMVCQVLTKVIFGVVCKTVLIVRRFDLIWFICFLHKCVKHHVKEVLQEPTTGLTCWRTLWIVKNVVH